MKSYTRKPKYLLTPINFGTKDEYVRKIVEKWKHDGENVSELVREAVLFRFGDSTPAMVIKRCYHEIKKRKRIIGTCSMEIDKYRKELEKLGVDPTE